MKVKNFIVKNKSFCFFAFLALLIILIAIFAPVITGGVSPSEAVLTDALQPPSAEHIFGTDKLGRDIFTRVIYGARTSLTAAFSVVILIFILGTILGVLAGYFGGWVDAVIMRVADLMVSFPGMVFAMAIAAVLNGGVESAVLALAAVSWPKYARIARSQTLALKDAEFMQAARLSGCSLSQLIFRHLLPNIIGPILATATMDIGTMMMEIAALSFLGLGAKPPVAEWGSMMSDGRSMLQTYPWVVLTPGLAVFVSVTVFNLLGDAVRDALDPRGITRM